MTSLKSDESEGEIKKGPAAFGARQALYYAPFLLCPGRPGSTDYTKEPLSVQPGAAFVLPALLSQKGRAPAGEETGLDYR